METPAGLTLSYSGTGDGGQSDQGDSQILTMDRTKLTVFDADGTSGVSFTYTGLTLVNIVLEVSSGTYALLFGCAVLG